MTQLKLSSLLSQGQIKQIQTYKPQTDEELWNWVAAILGVRIPRERVCPCHCAPFEAFADAYFARYPITIWKASRGFGGKSHLLALLALTEQITLGASVNLLGGSGEQSQRVQGYINGSDTAAKGTFWDAPLAPRWMLTTDIQREMRTSNGGVIKALMASPASVRGPHPQRLRLDEIDEMKQLIFDAAMGQTMDAVGIESQTVCSSTHQYPDGTMTEALKRAKEHSDWKVYEWCYRESLEPHGWLSKKQVEKKRIQVPAAMWLSEYDLQEPNPEGRAIDPEKLEALFDKQLGEFDGRAGKELIIHPPGIGEFYHGADWAKSTDWTVLHSMLECPNGPDKLAAWVRHNRKPYPVMIGAYNRRVEQYGGRAAHDSTGVGEVITDYLDVQSKGFDFRRAKERAEMLSNYVAAIENGEFVYPMIAYLYGEHKYCTNDDLYGYSDSSHPPDSVVAGALAYWAKRHGRVPAPYAGVGEARSIARSW